MAFFNFYIKVNNLDVSLNIFRRLNHQFLVWEKTRGLPSVFSGMASLQTEDTPLISILLQVVHTLVVRLHALWEEIYVLSKIRPLTATHLLHDKDEDGLQIETPNAKALLFFLRPNKGNDSCLCSSSQSTIKSTRIGPCGYRTMDPPTTLLS